MSDQGTTMTSSKDAGPVQIWIAYNDACNKGDHERAASLISPDLEVSVNGRPAVASAEQDEAVQRELVRCYPDYARDFMGAMEDGDGAAVEWQMRGSPTPGINLPPLDVPGCSLFRCADGRIVEARLYHPTGTLDLITDRALGR
jgi:SnoaL-like domain